MEDRLQNGAVGIGDVSILVATSAAARGAVPVPEAQCAATCRDGELLIDPADSVYTEVLVTAKVWWVAARESGKSPAVRRTLVTTGIPLLLPITQGGKLPVSNPPFWIIPLSHCPGGVGRGRGVGVVLPPGVGVVVGVGMLVFCVQVSAAMS